MRFASYLPIGLLTLVIASSGSLAQKGDEKKPSPKDPPKVVVPPRNDRERDRGREGNSNRGNENRGNRPGIF